MYPKLNLSKIFKKPLLFSSKQANMPSQLSALPPAELTGTVQNDLQECTIIYKMAAESEVKAEQMNWH